MNDTFTVYFCSHLPSGARGDVIETTYHVRDAKLVWQRVFSFIPNYGTVTVSARGSLDHLEYVFVTHYRN